MSIQCPNVNHPDFIKLVDGMGGDVEAAKIAYFKNGGRIPTVFMAYVNKLLPGSAQFLENLSNRIKRKFSNVYESISRLRDAAETSANMMARQAARSLRIGQSDEALRSAWVLYQGRNAATIQQWRTKIEASQIVSPDIKKKTLAEIDYALSHIGDADFNDLVNRAQTEFDDRFMRDSVNLQGIDYAQDYLPGRYEKNNFALMPNGQVTAIDPATVGRGGTAAYFKKPKVFKTLFEAIEAGFTPQNTDISALLEHRIRSSEGLIQQKLWVDTFRNENDPVTGNPIIKEMESGPSGPRPPAGYSAVPVMPGSTVAVHTGFDRVFDAITAKSRVEANAAGQTLLTGAGYAKHGTLLFDVFHLVRMFQYGASFGRFNWRNALALAEYRDVDLARAVQANEITQEAADFARANRPKFESIVKNGLNIGRVMDSLYADLHKELPLIGKFNRFTFEKVTRGLMSDVALREFDRVKSNNSTLSDDEVAARVARDINIFFGNLGRQGVFKDQTFRDLAQIIFLAPNWVESLATKEIRLYAKDLPQATMKFLQTGKADIPTITRGIGGGLVMYFIATQLLNLSTRGQFTFQNEEDTHKLDAWVPDLSGKTDGYFISPLSVFAEFTYDAIKYSEKKDTNADIITQILNNKLGPIARGAVTLGTGQDVFGQKLRSTWDRVEQAAISAAPIPIPVSGFLSPFPGMAQKQIMATGGVKADMAPTANQQIMNKAKTWLESKGIEAPSQQVYFADSPWKKFRMAVKTENDSLAKEAVDELLKTRPVSEIRKQLETQGGARPFTGQKGREEEFMATLTPQEKDMYQRALKERKDLRDKGLVLLDKVAPKMKETVAGNAVKKFKARKRKTNAAR